MLEKIVYRQWNNAYRIFNDTVELIVLADIGPRVIRYAFIDGDNVLHEVPEDAGLIGGGQFRLYGGHRLWVWPENDRTYFPDNRTVSVFQNGVSTRFSAPVEDSLPGTKLQKNFEITLAKSGSRVTISHGITNHSDAATDLAIWCPTMMRAGGRAILPLPPRAAMDKEHYQSVGPLTLWSFTDFADPRWILGTEFIQLCQNSNPKGRFKEQMTGIYDPAGWGAYYSDDILFLKHAAVLRGTYPDFGCNFEIFTNSEFLELETLAPIVHIGRGESCGHTETWNLFRNVAPGQNEDWIRSTVVPLAESVTDRIS